MRALLLVMVVCWLAVFAVAIYLDPYRADGSARTQETHRQLGLPPCTFLVVTGVPCPSCGMTTSFSLLMRGDVFSSLRANAVGTFLATFGLVFVPWAVASVICRRVLFIRSLELGAMVFTGLLLTLMVLRWGIVVGLAWWNGTSFEPPS